MTGIGSYCLEFKAVKMCREVIWSNFGIRPKLQFNIQKRHNCHEF